MPDETPPITIFLCGDVMTGRGIDQVLPHAGDPRLHEPFARDARLYVKLAERVNGPIKRPLAYASLWGDCAERTRSSAARRAHHQPRNGGDE